jgi:hypothetical protein
MNIHKSFLLLLLFLLLAGCRSGTIRPETLPAQLQVFGVQLHSDRDYREISGDVALEEPCLRGYERSFDRLQITIGYGVDRQIRKIGSRNPATSIFGISPGMKFAAAGQLLHTGGFTPYLPPHAFRNGTYLLTVQVDGSDAIAAVTLETLD